MNWLKLSAASGLVLTAITAAQTQAQVMVVVDMSKFTCEQLLRGTGNSIDAAVWISGYYNGLRKNTMLDLGQFKQNAEAVVAECAANPGKTVMRTIDTMLAAGRKKK